ncbi:MAG: TonB-dependent receptor, partial [Bacteroidota bacterium]|nr:TonB-dependent receptor [Bacteroidota bacterium]
MSKKTRLTLMMVMIQVVSISCYGQSDVWKGVIADSLSGEPIAGALVAIDNDNAAFTDARGGFAIPIPTFPVKIEINFIGYHNKGVEFVNSYSFPDTIFLTPILSPQDPIVISATRQGQHFAEVSQSMELIPQDFLIRTQTTQMQEVIGRLPGVQFQKGQVSIRGGSGFSYGTGSRVMVLIDNMPMLSADAGDAKWSFYPMENLQQAEVLKGASSVLYGSSALEGIIHLRTRLAADSPFTEIRLFNSIYDVPKRQGAVYDQSYG